jgi:hypothetical protein
MENPGPLRAVHTPNYPPLLQQLGASLLITTYQAGKLVIVRDEGDQLNTHFRAFKAPMGLALADGGARLAVGTTVQVWEFRDVADVGHTAALRSSFSCALTRQKALKQRPLSSEKRTT